MQEAKEKLGSGLAQLEVRSSPHSPDVAVAQEVEHRPYDLVILGVSGLVPVNRVPLAEKILRLGEHHLLLVPAEHAEPAHALVCVMSGEPGKEDVLFAGRFLRHLGAHATLMSVIHPQITANCTIEQNASSREACEPWNYCASLQRLLFGPAMCTMKSLTR